MIASDDGKVRPLEWQDYPSIRSPESEPCTSEVIASDDGKVRPLEWQDYPSIRNPESEPFTSEVIASDDGKVRPLEWQDYPSIGARKANRACRYGLKCTISGANVAKRRRGRDRRASCKCPNVMSATQSFPLRGALCLSNVKGVRLKTR